MQQLPVIQNKLISSVLFKSTRAAGQNVTHLRNWRNFLFSNIIEKKDESDGCSKALIALMINIVTISTLYQ